MRLLNCLVGVLLALVSSGCKTPDGPRLALPDQTTSAPLPAGYVRVVVFNDTFEAMNFDNSGVMRIQIDGQTAPSLYLRHYAQLFLKPGEHQLLLEHFDLFLFTDKFRLKVEPPATFVRIWTTPFGNRFEVVPELPANFHTRFIGGRDPAQWPAFHAE